MMRRYILSILLLSFLPALLAAQQTPIGILEYFDDERELTILDANGFDVNFYVGMGLNPGDRIDTGNTSVEIRLEPNGSILRLAPQTQFTIESLQGRDQATTHRARIVRGKMRMVAAHYTDRTPRYDIETPSGVAGVRGTDFGLSVVPNEETGGDEVPAGEEGVPAEPSADPLPTVSEELFVFDGEVIFTIAGSDESIFVTAGQRADIRGEEFLPLSMDDSAITERRRNLDFVRLDPSSVPGVMPQPEPETVDVPQPPPEEAPEPVADEPGLLDRMFGRLAEVSGMEVGSVTLNRQTYARVVFQPLVSVGDLTMAFYLPIIYQDDLFSPDNWYRPDGNNEWSFGSEYDWSRDTLEAVTDAATDAALKIRYLEYAERGDPFFLKAGNVSTFTLGQGLLMRNYANDVDFPAVRRIGVLSGFDVTKWGMEVMVNDLAAPEIYGGRIFFRPAAPVIPAAVGISAVTDLYPATTIALADEDGTPLDQPILTLAEATKEGKPLFLNVAMDLEVPIVDREIFSLIGFAEAGGFIPYLRQKTTIGTESVRAGLKTSALVDFSSGDLKNFGWTVGTRGNLLIADYRLEARGYDGIFRPAFYGPTYERTRSAYAIDTVNYLVNTTAEEYQNRTLAVAGEVSASIANLLRLTGGYAWPWEIDDAGNWSGGSDDELLVGVTAQDGLLPFGITAGAEYRRTHFAATVAGWDGYDEAHLFDAYTRLDAFARYPLSEIVALEARYSTAVVRDSQGNIVYSKDGAPQTASVLAIQTRIGF